MVGSTRALALLGALVSQAAGQPSVEQKWDWNDLSGLQNQIQDGIKSQTDSLKAQTDKLKDGIKSQTDSLKAQTDKLKEDMKAKADEWTDGIASYKKSVEQYTDALKDNSFVKAVQSLNVCKDVAKAEEDSAAKIESEIPEKIVKVDEQDAKACEAVADEVTVEQLKANMKEGKGDTYDKFMKLITQRSTASLCEGKHGISSWLEENAGLKTSDPEAYKEQLKKQLTGKMGGIMNKYTSQFCGGGDSDNTRLFAAGFTVGGASGHGALGLLAVFAVAMFGLGGFAVRRAVRQPQEQELEPLAPEEAVEDGQQL